ncbi:MAG: recombinase family protein [Eubacterium sp.]|nr:recombinase family protein [Eubacterium sp.]
MNKKTEKEITAIYVRVSTKFQAEEGHSIPAQLEKLHSFCEIKGWDNIKDYVDGGFSGSSLNRPNIQQLILDVEAGLIKRVIVFKLDRLSRSQKDVMYLIEDVFEKNGVSFSSLNENLDTSTPMGKAFIGILSVFAQLERENIYLRTRIGLTEIIKQGYWRGGGTTPYGYDYDPSQKILVPNDKAENVIKIYKMYLEGYSPQRIANILDLKYDRLVIGILTHKVYLGLIEHKGEVYNGKHQALITQELYDLVQEEMKRRSTGARATTKNHLLSGLIYCSCGSRMRYMNWGKGKYKLCCYTRHKDKKYMHKSDNCNNSPVWATEIEDIVINDLFNISVNLKNANKGYKEPTIVNPLKELEKQIKFKENQINNLVRAFTSGIIDENTFINMKAEFEQELSMLKDDYAFEEETQRTNNTIDFIVNEVVNIKDTWETMNDLERQTMIRSCVEKVVIGEDEVKIYYTFINANESKSEKAA